MSENHQFNEDKPQINAPSCASGGRIHVDCHASRLRAHVCQRTGIRGRASSRGATLDVCPQAYVSMRHGEHDADKRRCGLDLFGSLGNSSGLTPLSFDADVRNRIMDRDSVSYGFSTTECTENTEILRNSSGLSPLRPFGEIHNRNMSDYLGEGFTATESIDTRRRFSGISVPLSLCGEKCTKGGN